MMQVEHIVFNKGIVPAERREVCARMGLYKTLLDNEPQIRKNSFYDVFNDYTEDEFREYKHLAGIPSASKYEELLKELRENYAD